MEFEQFGPYLLIRPIATGGMGELYLAQRSGIAGFSKQLVVKRIRAEFLNNQEFTEMFLNEGRVAAFLDHPNIVHIYDLGEVDGTFFLAMEYVAGKDLGSLLKAQRAPLPLPAALSVMSAVCEGIHFAHESVSPRGEPLDLVHRDLNPQNVLLSYSGTVKIADFGIAKVKMRHRQETRVGILKGKFGYLSPEQARGSAIDRRSDIYALGLLLFETTVGQRAISGRSESDLLYAAVEGKTQRPSKLIRDYPPELERIYLKATARRPERRYQTVKELQNDLLAFQLESRLLVSSSDLAELMQQHFSKELELDRRALCPQDSGGVTRTEAIDSGQFEQKPAPQQGLERKPTALERPLQERPTSKPAAGAQPSRAGAQPSRAGAQPSRAGAPPSRAGAGLTQQESDQGLLRVKTEPYNPQRELCDPQLAGAQTQLQRDPAATLNDRETLLQPLVTSKTSVRDRIGSRERPLNGAADQDAARDRGWRKRSQADPSPEPEEVLEPVGPPPGAGLRLLLFALVLLFVGVGGIYLASGAGPSALEALRSWVGRVEVPPAVDAVDTSSPALLTQSDSAASLPDAAALIPDSGVADQGLPDLPPDLPPDPPSNTGPALTEPTPPARAKLQLTVTPQVTVYWRGKRLGRTPLQTTLPPGRHQLQLRDPAALISTSRAITLQGGQRQSANWLLEKGLLLVKARPWAHVEVNGIRRGTTPMPQLELYEGTYRVQLVNEAKGAPHTTKVVIRPGQTTTLIHAF